MIKGFVQLVSKLQAHIQLMEFVLLNVVMEY